MLIRLSEKEKLVNRVVFRYRVCVPTDFVSCPCCGMTVPPKALNFDEHGNRVEDPMVYGAFLKRRFAGGNKGIHWQSCPLPGFMLVGLEAQLETALAQVRAQAQTDPG